LYLPPLTVRMEKLVEWTLLAGQTEVLGENMPRRRFVHHKSYFPHPGANPGRRGWMPATNRFSYGAVWIESYSYIKLLGNEAIRFCFDFTQISDFCLFKNQSSLVSKQSNLPCDRPTGVRFSVGTSSRHRRPILGITNSYRGLFPSCEEEIC
jgi:hypothetical protein